MPLITNNKDPVYHIENISRSPVSVIAGGKRYMLQPGQSVQMTHLEFAQVNTLIDRGLVRGRWTGGRRDKGWDPVALLEVQAGSDFVFSPTLLGVATLAADFVYAFGSLPPVITSSLTETATLGQAFSYQITADNSPTDFNAIGLPSGLTINTLTGEISGSVTTVSVPLSQVESYQDYTVTAESFHNTTDASDPSVWYRVQVRLPALTITGSPYPWNGWHAAVDAEPGSSVWDAPGSGEATYKTIVSISSPLSNPTDISAQVLEFWVRASDRWRISVANDSANGWTADFSWWADQIPVEIHASNAVGTGAATLALTVAVSAVSPVITSPLSINFTWGQTFSYQIAADNAPTSFDAIGVAP